MYHTGQLFVASWISVLLCLAVTFYFSFSALTLLVGWQEGHPVFHHHLLSSNKIQSGDILVPSNLGPPGKRPLKLSWTENEWVSEWVSDNISCGFIFVNNIVASRLFYCQLCSRMLSQSNNNKIAKWFCLMFTRFDWENPLIGFW